MADDVDDETILSYKRLPQFHPCYSPEGTTKLEFWDTNLMF